MRRSGHLARRHGGGHLRAVHRFGHRDRDGEPRRQRPDLGRRRPAGAVPSSRSSARPSPVRVRPRRAARSLRPLAGTTVQDRAPGGPARRYRARRPRGRARSSSGPAGSAMPTIEGATRHDHARRTGRRSSWPATRRRHLGRLLGRRDTASSRRAPTTTRGSGTRAPARSARPPGPLRDRLRRALQPRRPLGRHGRPGDGGALERVERAADLPPPRARGQAALGRLLPGRPARSRRVGQDGTVRLWACTICGGIDELVALADARLAAHRRVPTDEERRRYGL